MNMYNHCDVHTVRGMTADDIACMQWERDNRQYNPFTGMYEPIQKYPDIPRPIYDRTKCPCCGHEQNTVYDYRVTCCQ